MDRRVIILKEKIADNLQEPWRVSAMAKSVNLSNSHLRQIFHVEIGKTPTQFVREIKLEKACELLEEGVLKIKEIAD